MSLEKDFWKGIFSDFADRTLRRNGFSKRVLEKQELEKISKWDFLTMSKEIIKGNEDEINQIKFFIKNVNVITFTHSGYYKYPLKMFYGTNYALCKKENFDTDLYLFLQEFPDFYLQHLEEYERFKQNNIKQEKIKQVAENNIQIMVKSLMKQTGYQYVLEMQETTCILKIKMKRKQMLEISLPHKTFTKRIQKILPTIELMKQTIENSDVRFSLKGYGNHMNWKQEK